MSNPTTDIRVIELFEEVKLKSAAIAEESFGEEFIALVKKVANYDGDVKVVANVTVGFDNETNTIRNDVKLSLQYANELGSYDFMEQVKRSIMNEFFSQVIKRFY